MTRVLIVAPTPTLRAGLRALLSADALQVVGEAPALDALASALSDVDVLVLADETSLLDAARVLRTDARPAIVVLSSHDAPAAELRALPLPGWGIVPPDASASELQAAIAAAAQGMVVLSPPLADRLLTHRTSMPAPADALNEPLTQREREVLELISQGLPNKLIGRTLGISEHTVKYHVSSIFTKLGATSRTDAVSRGARQGLISL